jgi:hypothetical protein
MGTNAYQEQSADQDAVKIAAAAVREFRGLRDTLIEYGVIVTTAKGRIGTPDDLFCNNWVSTHGGGTKILYPMLAKNRRKERRLDLIALLDQSYKTILDLSPFERDGQFLESTGSLVLDRVHKIAYAALSPRTDAALVQKFAETMKYEAVTFRTKGEIYHTNVMMAVGTGFAAICLECVDPADREKVQRSLTKHHEIIELTEAQISSFCGNMIELQNADGERLILMSSAAYGAITAQQKTTLLDHAARIVHAPIPTIERHGGGSARCMVLELF